jgi:hypothetical protein
VNASRCGKNAASWSTKPNSSSAMNMNLPFTAAWRRPPVPPSPVPRLFGSCWAQPAPSAIVV